MNDYERVSRIIKYLGDHFRQQPNLESLAKHMGLSPFHFHRLFRRWAGTTPKNFVQHLTALEAGRLLRKGTPVLDTALDVGLSGPARLHDLCVNLEAASPGEIRSGGEGWLISAGFCATPFGEALIASGPRGVCKLSFITGKESRKLEWSAARNLWPHAKFQRDDDVAKAIANSIFLARRGNTSSEPLMLHVKGTAFQMKVWRALIEIPVGEVRSYNKVAQEIESPQGARAVGAAVGSNPIGFAIPCHRVIHSTGSVGNYHWGSDRKKVILAWECCANEGG